MRTRASLVAAFVVALCGVAFAQTWLEYRPPGGGYRVEFPEQPKSSVKKADTPAGPIEVTQVLLDRGSIAFLISVNDYPQQIVAKLSVEQVLDGVRDGQISAGATLRNEQKLTMGNQPARRLILDRPDGLSFFSQIVFAGTRLFQAIYAGPKGTESGEDAVKFINSFALVDR
jgi:hypothetical protein